MVSFIHFNSDTPKAAFGQSFLEYLGSNENLKKYIEKCGGDMTPREAYKALSQVWRNHRPPKGVKGLYAFINNPYNITHGIIPRDVWEAVWNETKAKVGAKAFGWDGDDYIMDFIRSPEKNVTLNTAYTFQLDQVRRVFCHYRGKKEWVGFSASEFAAYAEAKCGSEEFEDIYEVFLELK